MRSLIFLIILQFVCVSLGKAETLNVLISRVETACVNQQSLGRVCRRNTPPYIGLKIRYWQPVLLAESVKRPGDSVINEYKPLVKGVLNAAQGIFFGNKLDLLDSGGAYGIDGVSTQMNDVHVYAFPMTNILSGLIEPACEGDPDFTGDISYLSEIDAVEWRTLHTEARDIMSRLTLRVNPKCGEAVWSASPLCVGHWGPVYPRGGFITGVHPAVGSAMAVYRAVHISSVFSISLHKRLFPVMFMPDKEWDKMQMLYPVKTDCMPIGKDPESWREGVVAQDGKYVWVYWRKKECCLF